MRRLLVLVSAISLFAAACTAGGGGDASPETVNPSVSQEPVTLTLWGAWTGRELKQFNQIFDGFEQQYPWITVKSVGGIGDPKITAAINSGKPPDAVLSFGVDNVGRFCDSGAWIDLNPYIEGPEGIDMSQFPPAALKYTSYNGIQCSLPFLTDTYGLYYNEDLLAKAGFSEPPRTTTELVEYAKKLTVYNDDGSIKVAGFVPYFGYYCCGSNTLNFGHMFGAQWYTNGEPAFATDPAWAEMFQWQKDFVDEFGAENLQKFVAGSADEFGSQQDFQIGRTAMAIDGEWRTAFIADAVPNLNYGTAPVPVDDDRPELYGSGVSGGTVIGIPRGSEHEAEAWLLIKYMATNTDALVHMGNFVRNVPTTEGALASPELDVTPQFQTFLEIFKNPGSAYKPTTPIGVDDQTKLEAFAARWQDGEVEDLQAGLQQVSQQVDDALTQAGV